MAWNPSLKVADARDLGKKHNKTTVIIFMIDEETLEYVSWGKDRLHCDWAKELADIAYDALMCELEAQKG